MVLVLWTIPEYVPLPPATPMVRVCGEPLLNPSSTTPAPVRASTQTLLTSISRDAPLATFSEALLFVQFPLPYRFCNVPCSISIRPLVPILSTAPPSPGLSK